MFDVAKFLDRAKAGAGVETDYALAKVTGLGKGNISNYRLGKSAPDERAIMALCRYSGDDPEDVAVRLQSMRAANDDAAGLWRRVAERLKSGHHVIVTTLVATLFAAMTTDRADASAALLAASASGSVYYVKLLLAYLSIDLAHWLAWQLVFHLAAAHFAGSPTTGKPRSRCKYRDHRKAVTVCPSPLCCPSQELPAKQS